MASAFRVERLSKLFHNLVFAVSYTEDTAALKLNLQSKRFLPWNLKQNLILIYL